MCVIVHHYGEDTTRVFVGQSVFIIETINKETGVPIVVLGPKAGVFEDTEKTMTDLTGTQLEELKNAFAHFCRDQLA